MKNRFLKATITGIYIAILAIAVQGQAMAHGKPGGHGKPFDRIFIFGDSLSDAGNVYAATGGQTAQPPYELIPSRPYDFKGFQFSNGMTWAQRFAQHLKSKQSGKAALFAPGVNGNYAFGGARARPPTAEEPQSVPSSHEQLGLFLLHYGGVIDPDALYVIQFGGNDIRDAIEVFFGVVLSGPQTQETFDEAGRQAGLVIQAAVEANIGMITRLYDNGNGARNFLVLNAPDLGVTPAIRGSGLDVAIVASMISGWYNDGLAAGLAAASTAPGISIDTFDLAALVASIIDGPKSYGIRNVNTPCLNFEPFADGTFKAWTYCKKSNKYLFWDGIHPTEKTHKVVAKLARKIYR